MKLDNVRILSESVTSIRVFIPIMKKHEEVKNGRSGDFVTLLNSNYDGQTQVLVPPSILRAHELNPRLHSSKTMTMYNKH